MEVNRDSELWKVLQASCFDNWKNKAGWPPAVDELYLIAIAHTEKQVEKYKAAVGLALQEDVSGDPADFLYRVNAQLKEMETHEGH